MLTFCKARWARLKEERHENHATKVTQIPKPKHENMGCTKQLSDSDNHILTNKKISYSGRCSCRFFLKFLQKTWRCWRWTFSQNTGKIRDMIDLFRGFCCVCNFVGSWFLQTIMTIGSIFPGKKGCSCCLLVFRPCSKKKMLIRFFYSAKFSLKNENFLVLFVISYRDIWTKISKLIYHPEN